jgi:TIR domain-containing protein
MTDVAHVGLPFSYDLFVTYSHGDDGSGNGFLQPWSAAFAKELERELRADRKFRQTLRVFLDQDLRPGRGIDPMAPLTEQLHDSIGSSAMLVVLMSPDYLASKWCTDERDWWFERQASLDLPTVDRVAVVKIWPTDVSWPPALTDSRGEPMPGFAFYSDAAGPPRPLGWEELPGPFGRDFHKALLGIVGRLYRELDGLQSRLLERERSKADAAKLAQEGGQSLYLHGRADRIEMWERAALELADNGFVVVPGEPDPVEQDVKKLQAIRERRVEALSDCDALLLMATDDTRALDADLVVVGKHDRQSARARTNRLLPCGLLNTVGTALATPVRTATTRIVQADWIDGTQRPWTPAIRQWLGDKSRAQLL